MKEKDPIDIRIIVATHKKYKIADDPIYLPVQVGREGKEGIGFIGDNTGDNISQKNKNYSELTAIYWAWKNLHCDYLGLCHYRRYFSYGDMSVRLKMHLTNTDRYSLILPGHKARELLSKYDVILPKKESFPDESVWDHYNHYHYIKDLMALKNIIEEDYPDYIDAFRSIMAGNELYLYNMFIMKKDLLDQYAEWLFDILQKLESRIDIEGYSTYQARVYGFISERLFNIWLRHHQHFKMKELKIVNIEA